MQWTDVILLERGRGDSFELLVRRADGYHCLAKVYVLMSYELVAAFRVMVDTDQLNIQYHNYSKSWCNVSHMDSSINLRPLEEPKHCNTAIHYITESRMLIFINPLGCISNPKMKLINYDTDSIIGGGMISVCLNDKT